MLKRSGQSLLAIMLNWKAQAGIKDSKSAITLANLEIDDMALVQNGEAVNFEQTKAQLEQETSTVNTEFDKTVAKRSKLMALMTETTQNSHF